LASKSGINLYIDDSVAASSTVLLNSAVIPAGKSITIFRFGGCDPAIADGIDSIIALQWGSGGSFETIRALSGCTYEFALNKTFVGDGSKLFRLVRINKSGTGKILAAWVEGVIL
jgi:hypothetical protein